MAHKCFISFKTEDMDYKKKIITLLDKVKTEQTFKQVYKLLEYLYLREAQDGLQERSCSDASGNK